MIRSIIFKAHFDRPLKQMCIPGECGLVLTDGSEVHLDFVHNKVDIDEHDKRTACVERTGLIPSLRKTDSFVTVRDILNDLFTFSCLDFYTGFTYEPSLVGVTDMYIGFENGEVVKVPHDALNRYFSLSDKEHTGVA